MTGDVAVLPYFSENPTDDNEWIRATRNLSLIKSELTRTLVGGTLPPFDGVETSAGELGKSFKKLFHFNLGKQPLMESAIGSVLQFARRGNYCTIVMPPFANPNASIADQQRQCAEQIQTLHEQLVGFTCIHKVTISIHQSHYQDLSAAFVLAGSTLAHQPRQLEHLATAPPPPAHQERPTSHQEPQHPVTGNSWSYQEASPQQAPYSSQHLHPSGPHHVAFPHQSYSEVPSYDPRHNAPLRHPFDQVEAYRSPPPLLIHPISQTYESNALTQASPRDGHVPHNATHSSDDVAIPASSSISQINEPSDRTAYSSNVAASPLPISEPHTSILPTDEDLLEPDILIDAVATEHSSSIPDQPTATQRADLLEMDCVPLIPTSDRSSKLNADLQTLSKAAIFAGYRAYTLDPTHRVSTTRAATSLMAHLDANDPGDFTPSAPSEAVDACEYVPSIPDLDVRTDRWTGSQISSSSCTPSHRLGRSSIVSSSMTNHRVGIHAPYTEVLHASNHTSSPSPSPLPATSHPTLSSELSPDNTSSVGSSTTSMTTLPSNFSVTIEPPTVSQLSSGMGNDTTNTGCALVLNDMGVAATTDVIELILENPAALCASRSEIQVGSQSERRNASPENGLGDPSS